MLNGYYDVFTSATKVMKLPIVVDTLCNKNLGSTIDYTCRRYDNINGGGMLDATLIQIRVTNKIRTIFVPKALANLIVGTLSCGDRRYLRFKHRAFT